jgi:hypothetical protein
MKDTIRFLKTAAERRVALPVIIITLILVTVGVGVACDTESEAPGSVELTAGATGIENDGVTLTIDNGDSFDWTSVKLTLNSSYTFTISSIAAGSFGVVGLGGFAQEDGTRFNPHTMKVVKLEICCSQGSYTVYWE